MEETPFLYSLIAAILLLAIGMLYYKYRKAKIEVLKYKKELQVLEDINQAYQIRETKSKEIMQSYLDILRKTISLSSYIADDTESGRRLVKIFNGIVYKQESLNSDAFYSVIVLIHHKVLDKFKQDYPNLTDKEFCICCLTYAKFSSKEIALIMNLKVTTIQMNRSIIRKKIGIEILGNISEYINTTYVR